VKFRQEFDVAETTPVVWAFFAQIERVATCIPGVEAVDLVDADTFMIRATQRVGPISATFESKVHITERIEGRSIQFTSTGKAVRGAVGNFRATNTVVLQPLDDRTRVTVEGEAALAGMLGSVGQKVINKQADKITAEFARNLEQALASPDAPAASTPSARPAAAVRSAPSLAAARAAAASGADGWTKAAALLSGFSLLVSMLVLWQVSSLP
jgi:carbon monoxide dehydrogenase subunit G